MAERWAVVVDDPDMGDSHGFIVEAESRDDAIIEGVRRAILADRLGVGVHLPKDADIATYVMPLADRERQLEFAEGTRPWAAAGRFRQEVS